MGNKKIIIGIVVSVLVVGLLVAGYFMFSSKKTVIVSGSSTVYPVAEKVAEAFMQKNPNIDVSVSRTSSGEGIKALINREIDIADASRPLKKEEIVESGKKDKHLEVNVIGRDAVILVVHKDNPLDNLDYRQIKSIFFKDELVIDEWSDLGIENLGNIEVYGSGPESSGTTDFFIEEIKENGEFIEGFKVVSPSSEIVNVIAENPNSIGFSSFNYASENPFIKIVPLGGVIPSEETIFNGDYILSRELFMVTEREIKDNVKSFIDFVLSQEGQEIVEEGGFIPVN